MGGGGWATFTGISQKKKKTYFIISTQTNNLENI